MKALRGLAIGVAVLLLFPTTRAAIGTVAAVIVATAAGVLLAAAVLAVRSPRR